MKNLKYSSMKETENEKICCWNNTLDVGDGCSNVSYGKSGCPCQYPASSAHCILSAAVGSGDS
jgi:hypothetical protein